MPIIEISQLNYSYEDTEKSVLKDINLNVNKGEFIAVLGHNGSGKSTLAKLLNVLYLPSSGKIFICNIDTSSSKNLWEIRQHAGMVFQNPDNQLVATVVKEDVAFGLENLGVPQENMQSIIDNALASVGMEHKADAPPHFLSGGQKQRIAIAGVLAMQPEIIIFDEATSMLDPMGRNEIINTVINLNKEHNITVVWITHFMEEAVLADRVVVLNHGEICLQGTPKQVFKNIDILRDMRLDVPPMLELSQFLRDNGVNVSDDILSVEEMSKELLLLNANCNQKSIS